MSTPTPTPTAVQPTLAAVQAKLLAAQNCHPNAVQHLIAEALDAIDAFARAPVAPGGQPLPQADSKEGFGDSVLPPVEPSGATLSPCAASQWISVSERLPPLNTEVLIAFDTSTLPATGQLTMYRGIRQWCWPAENDPVGDESLRAVTHWAFMRHPSEIGEWAQVGESSSEGGES